MNKIFLIGNGFDKAHGLKTSYNDFMLWYLKKGFLKVTVNDPFEYQLISVKKNVGGGVWNLSQVTSVYEFKTFQNVVISPYNLTFKSSFVQRIFNRMSEDELELRWCDVEDEYHRILHDSTKNTKDYSELRRKCAQINKDLEFFLKELVDYLATQHTSYRNVWFREVLAFPFSDRDLENADQDARIKLSLEEIVIINFNYTNLVSNYIEELKADELSIHYLQIHGKLDSKENPPIFGYGNKNLETVFIGMDIPELRSYAKSNNYRSNQERMVKQFVAEGAYQVCVLGHSCGTSDEHILRIIFNHPNLQNIKAFYYQRMDGSDNYNEIGQSIERIFNDNEKKNHFLLAPNTTEDVIPQVKNEINPKE